MYKIIAFSLSTFFFCCKSIPSEKNQITTDVDTSVNFLGNCKQIVDLVNLGSLQFPASQDSTEYFCFAYCYTCPETYELIFEYKGGFTKREAIGFGLSDEVKKGCDNNFKYFNCFAFVYPMRDPDKQKDIHADNVDYPLLVKTYRRDDLGRWHFLQSATVKTLKEYLRLEFATIYKQPNN